MFTQWRLMLRQIPMVLATSVILQGCLAGGSLSAIAQTILEEQETSLSNETEAKSTYPQTVSKEEALGVVRHRPQLKGLHRTRKKASLPQITDVSKLQDVKPTQWAYEDLRGLVERYGCVVGYPDQTFRGNQALSRGEFAAGLNACLMTIEGLLQENVAIVREDLEKLKRRSEWT